MTGKKKINENQKKKDLIKRIKKATANLYYISETDSEISPFIGRRAESVSKENLLLQTGNASGAAVEERNFEDFFTTLTKIQDWFGDEEKRAAQKFSALKELLQRELKNLKVFKVGQIELDIYVVGLDSDNFLTGIQMKAIET